MPANSVLEMVSYSVVVPLLLVRNIPRALPGDGYWLCGKAAGRKGDSAARVVIQLKFVASVALTLPGCRSAASVYVSHTVVVPNDVLFEELQLLCRTAPGGAFRRKLVNAVLQLDSCGRGTSGI